MTRRTRTARGTAVPADSSAKSPTAWEALDPVGWRVGRNVREPGAMPMVMQIGISVPAEDLYALRDWLELDPTFRKLDMTASMDRITAVLDHFYSDGAVDLYAFIKAQVQSMMDAETFKRTAPGWNCVDYPGAGMHYVPVAGGDCVWCGASPDEMSQS